MAIKKIAPKVAKKGLRKKKVHLKFNVECKNPVEDGILKIEDFETFLNEKIKINGKTGHLAASNVKVEVNKSKISVIAEIPFSKRYLKYLTKKYLKRNSLRDWLRVVAINRNTYELRYFHINDEEDAVPANRVNFRVIGGAVVSKSEFPWQAVFVSFNESGHGILCGATVIDEFWLMTAAHCVSEMSTKSYVLTGIQKLSQPAHTLKVKRAVIHPGYSVFSAHSDIALVQTYRNLLRGGVAPVCLLRDDTELLNKNPNGLVIGFGTQLENLFPPNQQMAPSEILLKTEVPIIPIGDCLIEWRRLSLGSIRIETDQICAGALLHGTTPGDSGGPLLVRDDVGRWVQVGITSFGADGLEALFDQKTYPGVYTRVSPYIPWIEKMISGTSRSCFVNILFVMLFFFNWPSD
ncbi:unnamed protein product [Caenorhabditis auriculariae]|uniref:Large ribosomal subunit protein eL22 n=1 Tax=Caenorhabditis auriculariae TaxID=2777116 RepID=A0A8S1HJ43_9PELO|nr:unnamed protein product [Caenorhabditis auriculariae]